MDRTLHALLSATDPDAGEPWDAWWEMTRHALADWLEEAGDGRHAPVRAGGPRPFRLAWDTPGHWFRAGPHAWGPRGLEVTEVVARGLGDPGEVQTVSLERPDGVALWQQAVRGDAFCRQDMGGGDYRPLIPADSFLSLRVLEEAGPGAEILVVVADRAERDRRVVRGVAPSPGMMRRDCRRAVLALFPEFEPPPGAARRR